MLARKARKAVAHRQEAVADASLVASGGTEAVGEQEELSILCSYHQIQVTVAINVADGREAK